MRADLKRGLMVYADPKVRTLLLLGFSAGLPFLLVFSTLSAWLTQAGVSRATIGYFSWVGMTYSIKLFWAPVVDRLPIPMLTRALGRRRSWMLLAQTGIALGLALMAFSDPAQSLLHTALLAVIVAFSSATQDIALDAYRIECAPAEQQGALAAAYQMGYRIALITAGAGALVIASSHGWIAAYVTMAVLMLIGMITVLMIEEPDHSGDAARAPEQQQRVEAFLARHGHWPRALRHGVAQFISAIVGPITDFFARNGLRQAALILLFIAVYRMHEYAMGVMANPFYLDMGYTLTEIATMSKVFGVAMTMLGVVVAGALVAWIGVARTLFIGALIIAFGNLFFSWLARLPDPNLIELAIAISVDNIGIGIAGTAFVAYLSSLTNIAYTATQYALFGSLFPLLGKVVAGFSGQVVEHWGYPNFFLYTASLTLPALALSAWFIWHPPKAVER
ncbi:MFS transporter [Sinimarinibacterium sp. NLF-5-8]|uniref:AmpG family muropeptide MFS transporter n=1 Tax=Sinimarinibacterium sp. NLF-5-8 TaxID=2698684 RepID=UPI00137BC182|nr:MFS transporter [Sinimarinibacterium sp. NLF-5-8]QHS10689.1 AmpG family muropeptide MFS transporter [Sinimarinibacterium sp. NLF-5-8]